MNNEYIEEVYFLEGFESALLGIGQQFNTKFAIYDKHKCIEVLMKDMSIEEAEEYFDFNMQGAYVGPNTPVFLYEDEEFE